MPLDKIMFRGHNVSTEELLSSRNNDLTLDGNVEVWKCGSVEVLKDLGSDVLTGKSGYICMYRC
ncbi:hypothetical protein HYFRA_00009200 [Hymenoscyphus fraxineus]|uniref:Uncharacterized protein n=1 Tax=Hymenoscyphus fraxineus TaxID=746836 RepID=A0A9N9PNZ7_9HELO|nr:hypothetical protein HYFRA_00009200 [Hymenoscyphus fraxineus]